MLKHLGLHRYRPSTRPIHNHHQNNKVRTIIELTIYYYNVTYRDNSLDFYEKSCLFISSQCKSSYDILSSTILLKNNGI